MVNVSMLKSLGPMKSYKVNIYSCAIVEELLKTDYLDMIYYHRNSEYCKHRSLIITSLRESLKPLNDNHLFLLKKLESERMLLNSIKHDWNVGTSNTIILNVEYEMNFPVLFSTGDIEDFISGFEVLPRIYNEIKTKKREGKPDLKDEDCAKFFDELRENEYKHIYSDYKNEEEDDEDISIG